jgi:general secretion pathway protein B
MSYILDALRKSEQQRKLVRDLKLEQATSGEAPTPRRPWWPVAFVLLVIGAAAGVGAYLALQPKAPPVTAPATAEPASTPQPPPASVATPTPASVATPTSDGGPIRDLAKQAQSSATPAPTPPAVARSQPDPQTVPFLREMPSEFTRSVPALTVNIHVYAPDPAQRVLYINNKQVREGEAVADGVYVESIVADGVVLQRLGTRFKLPRPQ